MHIGLGIHRTTSERTTKNYAVLEFPLVNREYTPLRYPRGRAGSRNGGWWTAWDSNPRPRRCERRALPTELAAHIQCADLQYTRLLPGSEAHGIWLGTGCSCWASPLPLRRLAQYRFIRSETSSRSSNPIDFLPRRFAPAGNDGREPDVRCNSSSEAITRSSFSFSAYRS